VFVLWRWVVRIESGGMAWHGRDKRRNRKHNQRPFLHLPKSNPYFLPASLMKAEQVMLHPALRARLPPIAVASQFSPQLQLDGVQGVDQQVTLACKSHLSVFWGDRIGVRRACYTASKAKERKGGGRGRKKGSTHRERHQLVVPLPVVCHLQGREKQAENVVRL